MDPTTRFTSPFRHASQSLFPALSFLLVLLFLLPDPHANARSWTDIDGRTISASFVSQTETEVVVKMLANNREFTIPRERLSDADREYLDLLAKSKPGRSFPVDPSSSEKDAGYVVVEAGTRFELPGDGRLSWVNDLERLRGEAPEEMEGTVLVEAGIQRFMNRQTREKLVILGAKDYELMEKVSTLPFVSKLRTQEREALMAVLAATKLEHGETSRNGVRELLESEDFQALSARDQGEAVLLLIRKSSPDLQRNFEVVEFHKAEAGTRWRKESRYTAFQIEDAVTAWENEIKINRVGRVPVVSLKENDETGLESIRRGLSCLPPEMVNYLGKVALHYRGEGFWWGGGDQIYYASPADLKFNGALVYVLAHEIGHCIQHQEVRDDWNDAVENAISFPSQYGLTNPGEDFAEFTSIVTRAWTRPQEMLEVEEVFPWRYEIYCRAVGYDRSKSRFSEEPKAE